jgi:zinc and cadmium transporter
MYEVWFYSILSVVVVSLISLIGVFTFSININKLKKIVLFFVSFASGALLGDAFIHLLPETVAHNGFVINISLYVLSGILVFFIVEKFIHWRHCHIPTTKMHPHPFAYVNLVGDGVHNLIDGMIIAASFVIDINVGIATTLAVILHEIPQEIGDFSILIHGGFKRKKALMLNLVTALTAVVGALIVLVVGENILNINNIIVPFAAGGFIYLACSDLIPELHKEEKPLKSVAQLIFFVLGIAVMVGMLFVIG